MCPHGHWSLVKDYALTRGQRTQTTLRGHFRKLWRLLTDFKGTIRWKNILKCVYKPYSTNKKIWNHPSLMKNLRVRIVVDFIDMQFLNFAIKYLCKNQKVCITNLAFSYGTQFEYFKQKNWSKISWPCPFNCCRKVSKHEYMWWADYIGMVLVVGGFLHGALPL